MRRGENTQRQQQQQQQQQRRSRRKRASEREKAEQGVECRQHAKQRSESRNGGRGRLENARGYFRARYNSAIDDTKTCTPKLPFHLTNQTGVPLPSDYILYGVCAELKKTLFGPKTNGVSWYPNGDRQPCPQPKCDFKSSCGGLGSVSKRRCECV